MRKLIKKLVTSSPQSMYAFVEATDIVYRKSDLDDGGKGRRRAVRQARLDALRKAAESVGGELRGWPPRLYVNQVLIEDLDELA